MAFNALKFLRIAKLLSRALAGYEASGFGRDKKRRPGINPSIQATFCCICV